MMAITPHTDLIHQHNNIKIQFIQNAQLSRVDETMSNVNDVMTRQ